MGGEEGYTLNIVGESKYQSNVRRAIAGEPVRLRLEPDNPHDKEAIAVEDCRGGTLGYIPRDSFLHRIIHDEERDCLAHIERTIGENQKLLGIQLHVRIKTESEGTCIYTGSVSQSKTDRPSSTRSNQKKSSQNNIAAQKAGKSIGKGIGSILRSLFK